MTMGQAQTPNIITEDDVHNFRKEIDANIKKAQRLSNGYFDYNTTEPLKDRFNNRDLESHIRYSLKKVKEFENKYDKYSFIVQHIDEEDKYASLTFKGKIYHEWRFDISLFIKNCC